MLHNLIVYYLLLLDLACIQAFFPGTIDSLRYQQSLLMSSKGFGKTKNAENTNEINLNRKKLPVKQNQESNDLEAAVAALASKGKSIHGYLNPKLFEDPETMRNINDKLHRGEVVVIPNAFNEVFAEAAYRELCSPNIQWNLNEAYFENGYAHKHHNVYDHGKWSARLNATYDVFNDEDTKKWMEELSGRDCSGDATAAPSYYKSGEYSLPHTDWIGQRTVAFVWHLSKEWKPEWGGALYWCQNPHSIASFPAAFNQLVLFSVTTKSAHFVTTVSPQHQGKRLTFNGWWNSGWVPRLGTQLDDMMTPEKRGGLTHTQLQTITDMIGDKWHRFAPGQKELLTQQRDETMRDFFPTLQ